MDVPVQGSPIPLTIPTLPILPLEAEAEQGRVTRSETGTGVGSRQMRRRLLKKLHCWASTQKKRMTCISPMPPPTPPTRAKDKGMPVLQARARYHPYPPPIPRPPPPPPPRQTTLPTRPPHHAACPKKRGARCERQNPPPRSPLSTPIRKAAAAEKEGTMKKKN